MPDYTDEQQARRMALPGAILMVVLTMSVSDPEIRLRDVIEDMDFVQEVKQAYRDARQASLVADTTEASTSEE